MHLVAALCLVHVRGRNEDENPFRREFDPPADAPAPPRPQEFRFSYRYNVSYPRHIERDNIASMSMASMDVIHLALQDAADDPFYFRIPKWGAAATVDIAIRFVSHEYGHLSTFSKAGYHQALFGDKDSIETTAPKASFGQMFLNGKILATKRRRGRPPKNPRPEDQLPDIPVPVHLRGYLRTA